MDRKKCGLTLIELLVIVVIIGLLSVLILPAVQQVREAARRSQCAHHLRQLGLALNQYEATWGAYPALSGYSVHARLLPHLERTGVYNALNTETNDWDGTRENVTVRRTRIGLFLCPSDQLAKGPRCSYPGNYGVSFALDGFNGLFGPEKVSSANVLDGLSHTAAFSEWLLSDWHVSPEGNGERRRPVFFVPRQTESPEGHARFKALCRRAKTNQKMNAHKGLNWLYGIPSDTLYNHVFPINKTSCTDGPNIRTGAYTSGSDHPGGAHVVFADAHVTFVKPAINGSVWGAIGSRNGGEIVSDL